MVEATISHDGGETTVEEFTQIKETEPWEDATPDIKVYYGDPQRDDSTYELYSNARIVEVLV